MERAAPSVEPHGVVRLQLRHSDFTTSARIVEAVNKKFGAAPAAARAENAGLVSVAIPPDYASRSTEFVAELESLPVDADRPARVVINERTGTIVLGKDVRISPVAILHGNLTVEIQTSYHGFAARAALPGHHAGGPANQRWPRRKRRPAT